jgi:dATP pyrophosphohydrolase
MRKPKNVLVFLYRYNSDLEYCLFYRKKEKFWQGISGGVEDLETLEDTVKREVYEETGIKVNRIIKLDTISSIPGINVNKMFNYVNNIYVVYEYAFGVLMKRYNYQKNMKNISG